MALCHYYLLLGIIGGWIGLPAAAQTLHVEENQRVYVTENTTVTLGGGLRNQGLIINEGSLHVLDDWTNEGRYEAGSNSEVVLSDRAPQRVDQRGQVFHRLIITGGGDKNLLSEARVKGTLTLTEGVVIPQPSAPLLLTTSATVMGGSEQSYVENSMRYQGNGTRLFPLGLDGDYLPITFTDVTGDSPTLQVSVVSPNPPASAEASIERVSGARYWSVAPVAGSFEGAIAELTVNDDDGLADLVGAIVTQAERAGGLFGNAGQSARSGDAGQGTVTSESPVQQAVVAVALTGEFALEDEILVPSAFAPEAPDPVNRLLKVYATTLLPESFAFRIFDRWGTLVYRTTSLSQALADGWDGRWQSDQSLAPAGVYQYHLQGILERGTPVDQRGTITLFR